MAFCIGYFLSYLTMQSPSDKCNHLGNPEIVYRNECSKCPVCEKNIKQAVNDDSTQMEYDNASKTLHKRFRPKSMYEVIQYDYFDKKAMYNAFYGEPKHGLLRHEKNDIEDAVDQVLNELNDKSTNGKWKVRRVINGYRRLDPLRGQEYVLDLELSQLTSKNLRTKLLHIDSVKPFQKLQIVKQKGVSKKVKIHFILPIAKVGKRFKKFIDHFENTCLKTNENVALRIVLFTAEDILSSQYVKNTITALKKKYTGSDLTIIERGGQFSRGLGLHLGVEHLSDRNLMYFCDVDVIFTSSFLNRCRHNSVQNEQVYYPLVFAQYDPHIVQSYSPLHKFKDYMDITKYTGIFFLFHKN